MNYIVGTSGWNYEHWKQKFYSKAPAATWLERYADIFRTIEVNNTFYRWPTKKIMENWYARTPADFKFTIKIPRSITHRKEPDAGQVSSFYEIADSMKEKMGCFLFQFPPRFKNTPENFDILEKFLMSLNNKKDNALEFRDKSWWNERVYEILKKNNIGFVSVNGLSMPKDILSTAEFAYVRLHGLRYDTLYTLTELNDIARKITRLEVERTYVYFDNDQNAFAPQNAKEIMEILEKQKI